MVDCLDVLETRSRRSRDEVQYLNETDEPKAKGRRRGRALPWREGPSARTECSIVASRVLQEGTKGGCTRGGYPWYPSRPVPRT